jgi:hypothetical protein
MMNAKHLTKTAVRNVAAGTVLGGGLLLGAGMGLANAQPLQQAPDGLVDVTIADQTILEGVSTDEAAAKTAAICGSEVAQVTTLAGKVDAEGTDQTVCTGLPGGDLVVTQNSAAAAPAQPGAAERGTGAIAPGHLETPDSAPFETTG